MAKDFSALRALSPVFRYVSFAATQSAGEIVLRYQFSIPGLANFAPTIRISTAQLTLLRSLDDPIAQRMVFSLGLAEAVSYWKCACPPSVQVLCGGLGESDDHFWRTLWYHGLGEFFHRNGIQTNYADFVHFDAPAHTAPPPNVPPCATPLRLIPIGGGKDSCVSLHLLRHEHAHNRLFTINDQPARTDCIRAAGYADTDVVRCYRTIDPELLRLNRAGYLNGHTPFSAVTAFLSVLCAYLIGADEVVLSNESSANEASVAGTDINHQYSKSVRFERDFRDYCARNFGSAAEYYSLLRPFNELQIAAQFSALPQFHRVFRSCNVGSKTNVWCGQCGKCLFTFGMLSAFLPPEKVTDIFGKNLLADPALLPDFAGLLGLTDTKPFECVGTTGEFAAAMTLTLPRYEGALPPLLRVFQERVGAVDPTIYLAERNPEHFVPPAQLPALEEMFRHATQFC
ncbi:MAG: hypothetical protein LBN05_01845 [Oscillospiraceae bacterium]|jgi:hypothetical protein|nr:hypothetical protein [Oscillospiraceae bacterium]